MKPQERIRFSVIGINHGHINRTPTSMQQEHCLLAAELALKAQEKAVKFTIDP